MVDGSAASPTASLMELSTQLHGGSCVDSFKAVVLVLPVVGGCTQERYTGPGRVWGSPWAVNRSSKGVGSPWMVGWSWKGVSTLEGILLRWAQPSAGVHQAQ